MKSVRRCDKHRLQAGDLHVRARTHSLIVAWPIRTRGDRQIKVVFQVSAFHRCLLLYIMTLWGNKNRVRELEYIMVILMISQQMQPENTANTIKWNALMTSQLFYGLNAHRQAISILAWVKTSFIDVRAKAPLDVEWKYFLTSPLPHGPSAKHTVKESIEERF